MAETRLRSGSVIAVAVLMAAGLLAGAGAEGDDGLAALSGRWTGTRKVERLGDCRRQEEGENAVRLDLKVKDDGQVEARDLAGRVLRGTIDSERVVRLVFAGRTRCRGSSDQREWTAEFVGQVSASQGSYVLNLEGTEEPCPPECRFKVEYAVRKD